MATKQIEKIFSLIRASHFPTWIKHRSALTEESLQAALLKIWGKNPQDISQNEFQRIHDALQIATEIKKLRGIGFEHLLSSDPQTGIETLAILSKRETNPDRRASECDIIAMILSDYLRVIEGLQNKPVEAQREQINSLFDKIFAPSADITDVFLSFPTVGTCISSEKSIRSLRSTPNIEKIRKLTKALIRVSTINLLERSCAREVSKRKGCANYRKARYEAFDHMVAGIVDKHESTILIRGAQKLIQAQNRLRQQGLHKEDRDELLSELEGIYIPLSEAYHYNALAKSLKDLVFEAREPEVYNRFKDTALQAARACVPEERRKCINDMASAEGMVCSYVEALFKERIQEHYRSTCVVEVRLKNLSDVRNKLAHKDRAHARDFIGARIVVKIPNSERLNPRELAAREKQAVTEIYNALLQPTVATSRNSISSFTHADADAMRRSSNPLAEWYSTITDDDRVAKKPPSGCCKQAKKKRPNLGEGVSASSNADDGLTIAKTDFFDDYLTYPRPTGYQALQNILKIGDGVCEVQVVGHEMRKRNESGNADHAVYAQKRRGGVTVDPSSAAYTTSIFVLETASHVYDNDIVVVSKGDSVADFLARKPEDFFAATYVTVERSDDSSVPTNAKDALKTLLSSGDRVVFEGNAERLTSREHRESLIEEWGAHLSPALRNGLMEYHHRLGSPQP
ncbi:MAG: hypothetical protein ABTQ34_04610 [Bdellovibrionales bacterium]